MKPSSFALSAKAIYLSSRLNLKIVLAFLAIIIGGHIYIIYRPDSLLMFSWLHLLGLDKYAAFVRQALAEHNVADWVVYNLPTGLWLLSYMLIIDAVWGNETKDFVCKVFLYFLPCIDYDDKQRKMQHAKELKEKEEKYLAEQKAFVLQHGMPDKIITLKEFSIDSDIIVYEAKKIIYIEKAAYQFHDILGCTISDSSKTEKSKLISVSSTDLSNTIGRSIVGGMVAGPVGAVIGGSTSKQNTKYIQEDDKVIHDYTVFININSLTNPLIKINVGENQYLAQEISSLMNVIVSRNKSVN